MPLKKGDIMSIFIFTSFLTISQAYANDDEPEPKIVYKKETQIDFEEIQVEGQLIKPQGSLILERQRAAFNPLISLRENFNHETTNEMFDVFISESPKWIVIYWSFCIISILLILIIKQINFPKEKFL